MLKYTLILILLLLSQNGFSQITPSELIVKEVAYDSEDVEITADFPGGINAFRNYVGNHFAMPDEEASGSMIIVFIVDTDGCVKNIEIVRNDLDTAFAEEALRVFDRSPTWTPAEKDGKKVRMRFRMPLRF